MSIETSLAELKASIDALNASVIAGNEGRAAVLEAAQAASTKTLKKTEPKTETKVETPPAETTTTEDPVSAAFLAYMDGTEGAERDARKAKVKAILKKVGAEKVTDVPEGKKAAFIKAMGDLKAAGNLIAEEAEDDDNLLGD